MLTPAELRDRCIELGILAESDAVTWNGMCLESETAWFTQPSPKQFPDRIARATYEGEQEVVDVFDASGFLFRLGADE